MESFLGGMLLEEGLIPSGSVIDAGAQFGEQACHYARLLPGRTVYAIDPSPSNVAAIKNEFGRFFPNLKIRQGGLGKEVGTMAPRDSSFNMAANEEFPIYTIDR
jgi:FkbM family methyltransferase